MRVFLIGYMGVGKTTIGQKLAKRLDIKFIDLDASIEMSAKCSVANIIQTKGENYFRELEHRKLKELLVLDNILVSTGGGTPCYYNNMQLMLESGTVVYLEMDEKSLVNRLIGGTQLRPLILGKSKKNLSRFVHEHLSQRLPYYKQAHFRFNALNVTSSRLCGWVNLIMNIEKRQR